MAETQLDPRRECYSKSRYSTERFARRIAARASAERKVFLRVYACRFCGGYHLTHRPEAPALS